jgi:HTH-type transcriptional regulator / antitoxin HipB
MSINSVHQFAATIRGRRLALGRSQAEVATAAGVSRDWLIQLEAGKPTVEFGLVMDVIDVLGLTLDLVVPDATETSTDTESIDLDALLDEYRNQ